VNAGGATLVESVQVCPPIFFVSVSGAANLNNSKSKIQPAATAVNKPDAEETLSASEISVVPPCGLETTPKILPSDFK
jgi:hypothetical protein